jgi:hypothetical protein
LKVVDGMNRSRTWCWPAFAAATTCAFAPLAPEVARSAYGFRATELWFAVAYLLMSSSILLALSAWLLRKCLKAKSPARLLAACMVVLAGTIALLLLPYAPAALLLLQFKVSGDALAPHASLLATKYLHAFSLAAWESHTWIIFPIFLAAMFIFFYSRRARRGRVTT